MAPITFERFAELVTDLRDDPAHPVARNVDDLLKAAQDLADAMDAEPGGPSGDFTPAELQAMLTRLGHLVAPAPDPQDLQAEHADRLAGKNAALTGQAFGRVPRFLAAP